MRDVGTPGPIRRERPRETAGSTSDSPSAPGGGNEPPARRRFRDLLHAARDREPAGGESPAAARRRPEEDLAGPAPAAACRCAPQDAPIGSHAGDVRSAAPETRMPEIALRDVSAAVGAEGARLCLTVDEGSLAGLRVGFLLRGATLDVSVSAPSSAAAAAVLARETEMRGALADRGIEMGSFDMAGDDEGRRPAHGWPGAPHSDDRPRIPPGAPAAGVGGMPATTTGRDYTR